MTSEEGSDADGKEEQSGGDDATATWAETDRNGTHDGGGSLAVQPEDKLREAWPQIKLDGDKGLVVCTVDVQLLTGVFFCVDLLRVRTLFQRRGGDSAERMPCIIASLCIDNP